MPRPFTGKTHTGIRRVVRPNGDVYVYQRVTQYDPETRKTKTIKSTLLGILDPKTGKTRPTRGKSEKNRVGGAVTGRLLSHHRPYGSVGQPFGCFYGGFQCFTSIQMVGTRVPTTSNLSISENRW